MNKVILLAVLALFCVLSSATPNMRFRPDGQVNRPFLRERLPHRPIAEKHQDNNLAGNFNAGINAGSNGFGANVGANGNIGKNGNWNAGGQYNVVPGGRPNWNVGAGVQFKF